MGVDFYTCANCSDTFPDCGDYFSCDCGYHFCSTKCGKYESREPTEEECSENDYEEYDEIITCIFCRHEQVTDRQLLIYLLKKYNLIEDQLIQECLEDAKNGK